MHYYLADDTIEIKEVNYPNSGRDPFSMMLRRQKLPRKFSLNQPGQTYAEDFIRPQDIQHGQVLLIYNRKYSFISRIDSLSMDAIPTPKNTTKRNSMSIFLWALMKCPCPKSKAVKHSHI